MNLNETKLLLKEIAVIDNRKLSEEVAEAWQSIISFMPFEIAREALKLARKDATINWLEPKHIVGWAKEAAFRLDRDKPLPAEPSTFAPQPTCREHNEKIISCAPCCKRIKQWEKDNGSDGLHKFAKAEIYA